MSLQSTFDHMSSSSIAPNSAAAAGDKKRAAPAIPLDWPVDAGSDDQHRSPTAHAHKKYASAQRHNMAVDPWLNPQHDDLADAAGFSSDQFAAALGQQAGAGSAKSEKEKLNEMGVQVPGQPNDEFFETQSDLPVVSRKLREKRAEIMGDMTPTDDQYIAAHSEYQNEAIEVIHDTLRTSQKIPEPLVQAHSWLCELHTQNLPQFFESPMMYDLDLFGNMILAHMNTLDILFGFGRWSSIGMLLLLSFSTCFTLKDGLRLNIVLCGAPSKGKSYLQEKVGSIMNPGVFRLRSYETARSKTAGGPDDMHVNYYDESTPAMVGGSRSGDKHADPVAEAINKSVLTTSIVRTRTILCFEGKRQRMEYVSTQHNVESKSLNDRIPSSDNNALAARHWFVHVASIPEQEIDSIINRCNQEDFDDELRPARNELKRHQQLFNMYHMLVEWYIRENVVHEPNMDAFKLYFARFNEAMQAQDLVMSDAKKHNQIELLARQLTVRYAVHVVFCSELTRDIRFDAGAGRYRDYFDVATQLIPMLDSYLVCTRSIAVYALSLARSLWDNPVVSQIIDAARDECLPARASWTHVFDGSCFETLVPQAAADGSQGQFVVALQSGPLAHVDRASCAPRSSLEPSPHAAAVVSIARANDIKFERRLQVDRRNEQPSISGTPDYNYIEITPESEQYLAGAVERLRAACKPTTPSKESVRRALEDLKDRDINAKILHMWPPSGQITAESAEHKKLRIIKVQRNTRAYDELQLNNKNGSRVFISTYALLNYRSLDDATAEALRSLPFQHSIAGRSLTSMPLRVAYTVDGANGAQTAVGDSGQQAFRVVEFKARAGEQMRVNRIDVLTPHLVRTIACSSLDNRSAVRTFEPPDGTTRPVRLIDEEPERLAFEKHGRRTGVSPQTAIAGYAPLLARAMFKARRRADGTVEAPYNYPQVVAEDIARHAALRRGDLREAATSPVSRSRTAANIDEDSSALIEAAEEGRWQTGDEQSLQAFLEESS